MIVLVVAVFLFTFVIPIARGQHEGFASGASSGSSGSRASSGAGGSGGAGASSGASSGALSGAPIFVSGPYSTDPTLNAKAIAYISKRQGMIDNTNVLYNNLSSAMDPLLPSFIEDKRTPDGASLVKIKKAIAKPQPARGSKGAQQTAQQSEQQLAQQAAQQAQYASLYAKLVQNTNKSLSDAYQTPDVLPNSQSPTLMGALSSDAKAVASAGPAKGALASVNISPSNPLQLPPPSGLVVLAQQCEANLVGRDSCSMLDNSAFSQCGVCIAGGTQYDGSNPDSFIGGLLAIKQDKQSAIDSANGGTPNYYPTLGQCPPGMFFVDSSSCQKAANRQNCNEVGNNGGFYGGGTAEGKMAVQALCAQAPYSGANTFVYQPNKPASKLQFDVVLRCITPFGTGITKIIVTHYRTGKTYRADNAGNPGQEFTLTIPKAMETDDVDVRVSQEIPHRPKGKVEVFRVMQNATAPQAENTTSAATLCNRLGAKLASSNQVAQATANGLQGYYTSITNDSPNGTIGVYGAQSGGSASSKGQTITLVPDIPLGGNPSSGFDDTGYTAQSVWCYGYKPAMDALGTSNTNTLDIKTVWYNWFDSFGKNAQPAQGPSIYSQFSSDDNSNPPGISERAVTLQWEMKGSSNRIVPFQTSIIKVNSYPASGLLRLLGPFNNSSIIAGPAWSSSFTMVKSLFWYWSNKPNQQSVIFSAKVPGLFVDPFYPEDLQVAPTGPLVTNPETAFLLQSSACDANDQQPGAYGINCLLQLFKGAGGDPSNGLLATQNGGLLQLNSLGDVSAITGYLNEQYITATTGRDSNGNSISTDMQTRVDAMNMAAMNMFGFNIINPCEMIVDNADGTVALITMPLSQVQPVCLQYLWLNNNSDADRKNDSLNNSLYSNTYTSIADRFSGLRKNEATRKRRDTYPFQACQVTGAGAPIKNGKPDMKVISNLMSMNSLSDVQDYFNTIHKTANYTKGPQDSKAQSKAIQQCYGFAQTPGPTANVCARS